ncbi:MAG: hypothetical protein GF403_09890 [Candidatus Coatesbacteria bacterium]|nr:hypothetical protein [Candidatus Coatesbacteria bacterium]
MVADINMISSHIEKLSERDALTKLFVDLNYAAASKTPFKTSRWENSLARESVESVRVINERGGFPIVHAVIPSKTLYDRDYLPRSPQRAIVKQIEKNLGSDFFFVVFSDPDRRFFDFTSVKLVKGGRDIFRRLYIEAGKPKRTAVERLARLYATSDNVAEIQGLFDDAFDVQAVTKEFYLQYKAQYEKLATDLKSRNKNYANHTNLKPNELAQRILGRVMFLYFLQRKGWLGNETEFLRREFNRVNEENQSYFNDVLEKVWFECLNKPRADRRDIPSSFETIPYLNGGLFTPDDYYENGKPLYLPNEFFSTDTQSGEGDGLLDVFDRYNFTIEESTPLDQEVAVDPEMLGKVLENLLEVEERHSDGVYYTPRPIVDFMCRESLLGHLSDATGLERGALAELLDVELLHEAEYRKSKGQVPPYALGKQQAKEVIDALDEVKILDPAVGSGAFPLGMMQNLMQLYRAARLIRGSRTDRGSAEDADQKKQIIANNLYGVDIKPEAIEICRLRLWLSLVVEQASPDDVDPLPNLDFKFMVGDSLIEEIEGVPVYPVAESSADQGTLDVDAAAIGKAQRKLIRLEAEYYDAHTAEGRRELRAQLDATVRELLEAIVKQSLGKMRNEMKTVRQALAKRSTKKMLKREQELIAAEAKLRGVLQDYDDPGKPLPFFPYRLFFGEVWRDGRLGFDIVIANPPYVRQETFDAEYKNKLARHYKDVYTKTCDIYVPFYKRGFELLKPGGHLTFISSGTYARTGFGKKLRNWLRENVSISRWVDFGDLQPFEGQTTYPVVPVMRFAKPEQTKLLEYYQLPDLDYGDFAAKVESDSYAVPQSDLADDGYRFLRDEVKAVFDKIVAAGRPLGEVVGEIYRGVLTGLNEAFIVDGATKERLIAEDPKSVELLKPFLMGRDLKPWRYEFNDRWLIFTRRGVDIDRYPAIKRHLEGYKERLMPRPSGVAAKDWPGRKPGNYKWYEIQDAVDYYKAFEGPKVMWGEIVNKPSFIYDTSGIYFVNKGYLIRTNSMTLLGILNSCYGLFFMQNYCVFKDRGYYDVIKEAAVKFPIPSYKQENKDIIKIVNKHISGMATASSLHELNVLCGSLYNLSESESIIIENNAQYIQHLRQIAYKDK